MAPRGYTATRITELLEVTDVLSVANRTTDIAHVNEDLEHRFRRYGTNEVFTVHDWAVDAAGRTAPVLTNPVNIFTDWNKTTPAKIDQSCQRLLEYTDSPDERKTLLQDLQWSYHGVLNSIVEPELRKTVIDTLAPMTYPSKCTGPMALYVLLTHLTSCSPGALHDVKHKVFYSFNLGQVPGQNVIAYNATILKTTTFLRGCGVDLSDAPWRVLEAYKKGPPDFALLFSTLEAAKDPCLSNLDTLLQRGQEKYEMELARNNWVPTPARGGFYTPPPSNPPSGSNPGAPPPGQDPPMHDRGGRPIDRTPPAPGKPTTRTNPLTQREEKWCGNCPHGGRWGNHSTQEHDTWQAELKKRNEARKKKKKAEDKDKDAAALPAPTAGTPAVGAGTPAPPASDPGPLEVTAASLRFCSSAFTNPGF
jgi:hypothetical protein